MKIINVVKTSIFLVLCLFFAPSSYAQFAGGYGGGNVQNDLQASKVTLFTTPGNYSQTQLHENGNTISYADLYMDGSRYMLATIQDPAGGNNFDSVRVDVSVYANHLFNGTSRYFLPRKYNINPISNGPATVTMYFSQSDFDVYNLAALYHAKLPLNGTDSLNNKANVRVYRTSTNSETPNLVAVPSPSLTWNNTDSFWVLTFTVTDSVRGDYFISTPFLSDKMVTSISHNCPTPVICQTTATATINWGAVSGAQDYRMRFRPQGAVNWNVSTITPNTRTMTNLSFNTTYEIQLRVRESAIAQGEYTGIYTFTTPAAPNYPVCNAPATSSHQVISSSSALIRWSAVSNGATYAIEMKPTTSSTWGGTTIADTTYTFGALSPNTSYNYRIRTNCTPGTSCASNSSYTAVGTFTTLSANALPVCMPPTNLSVNNLTASSATVNWTSADFAQIYFVQMKLASSSVWGGGSTVTTSRTFNNVMPNTAYNYRIRTTCSTGTTSNINSAFTATGTFTTNPLPNNALFAPQEALWSVYPNPTNNEVHVAFVATETTPVQCQLFDLTGRQLKNIQFEPIEGQNQIDFSIADFVPGMYTLKVIQNNTSMLIQRIQKL